MPSNFKEKSLCRRGILILTRPRRAGSFSTGCRFFVSQSLTKHLTNPFKSALRFFEHKKARPPACNSLRSSVRRGGLFPYRNCTGFIFSQMNTFSKINSAYSSPPRRQSSLPALRTNKTSRTPAACFICAQGGT